MKRLSSDIWSTARVVLNAVLGIGLAALLLTDPSRLTIGGTIILMLIGGGLVYFGLRGNLTGLSNPRLVRRLFLIVGAVSLLISAAMIAWTIRQDFPTEEEKLRRQVTEARRNETSFLDLSDMRLEEIPPEVFELTEITHLNLSDNQLANLPEELGRLTQLTTLDASYNRLITVPTAIGDLTSLEHLYLRHNELIELPPEIGELRDLETLNVAENKLQAVPAAIQQLSNLRQLILFQNELTALPTEVVRLRDLQILAVEYNEIPSLPEGLAELPNLHTLRLTGNPIYDLPSALTMRAGEGDLTLEHDPDKREPPSYGVGAVNAFFTGMLVLILAITGGIEAWIRRRNAKVANQLSARGQVFRIPPFARAYCILVLLLVAFATIFLLAEGIRVWRVEGQVWGGVFVPLILSPLWLFCVYMLIHNSGFVVLTLNGVILHRLGREKQVSYEAITDIRELALALPPNIVIKGPKRALRIPRSVEAFATLYATLIRTVEPADELETPEAPSPLDLRIPRWVINVNVAGALVLTLFYLAVGSIGFWLPSPAQATPPIPVAVAVLIFGATSMLFVPLIIFYVLETIRIEEPAAIVFLERAIRFRFPFREWQIRSPADLIAVDLKTNVKPTKITVGPFEILRVSRSYPLVIRFSGGQELRISEDRARQLGVTPEHIYVLLQDLYNR
jgi:hypothetical protein